MNATIIPCETCGRGVGEACKKSWYGEDTTLWGKPHRSRLKSYFKILKELRHA